MITDRLDRLVKQYPDRTNPGAGYQLLLRLRMDNMPGMHGRVATVLGDHGAQIIDIDIADVNPDVIVRDFIILCDDEKKAHEIVAAVQAVPGVEVQHASDRTFQLHRRGKIEVANKVHIRTNAELSHVYTPGVGRVSMAIHHNPDAVWSLTIKPNTVAVVTDGTAVLGLGDIGPEAAMPVMEGKSMLFKSFADIDAWPICLNTKDTEEIIAVAKAISPGFGGILLEDISAPRCFEVEERLQALLDIPVMHDDQHGTAVVSTAALMTAAKRAGVEVHKVKIGQIGLGAAGNAIGKMLMGLTGNPVYGSDLNEDAVRRFTDAGGRQSSLREIMAECDIVIATTGAPNLIKPEMVRKGQIVFALSNPNPEIDPDLALANGAAFAADGKSVNNVLGFPGIFRGAVDANAPRITHEMLIAAMEVLVRMTPAGELLPNPLDKSVHREVARAVAETAIKQGIARAEYVPYVEG